MSSNENKFSRDLFSPEEAKPYIDNFFKSKALDCKSSIMICKKCLRYVEPILENVNDQVVCSCPCCHNVILVI